MTYNGAYSANTMHRCIFRRFKTFEEFWEKVKVYFLIINSHNIIDQISAHFYYEYWKMIPYLGSEEAFLGKFCTEMASKFYEISKREKLYNEIFPQLHTWTQLINVRTVKSSNLLNYIDKPQNLYPLVILMLVEVWDKMMIVLLATLIEKKQNE